MSWSSRSLASVITSFLAGVAFGTWMGWVSDPSTYYGSSFPALAGLAVRILSLLIGLAVLSVLLGLVWWLAGPRTSAEEYRRPDRWLVVGGSAAALIVGFLIGAAFLGGRITYPWPFGS